MQQVEGGSTSHTLVPLRLRSRCHCIEKIVKFGNVPEDIAEEIAITWTFGAVLDMVVLSMEMPVSEPVLELALELELEPEPEFVPAGGTRVEGPST